MYHYVRDLRHNRYPEIKGLDIGLFKEQILYLNKHYHFITMEMLVDAIENNSVLPEKSVLLTFDDAYSDHFTYVFPLLDKYKIQGSFFAPVKAVTEHKVLDVNKIHFILASEPNKLKIITEIENELDRHRDDYELESFSFYYEKLAQVGRYDSADIVFIKRMLQVELEESLRNIITSNLFEKIVGRDEESFSRELYMDIEQIKCMNSNDMYFGGHGYNHQWLGSLNEAKQRDEIEKSAAFLKLIESDRNYWSMCYPYGSYDEKTVKLLEEYDFKLGLTTVVDIADIHEHNRYMLPRLNTNDIPKSCEAAINDWYLKC